MILWLGLFVLKTKTLVLKTKTLVLKTTTLVRSQGVKRSFFPVVTNFRPVGTPAKQHFGTPTKQH